MVLVEEMEKLIDIDIEKDVDIRNYLINAYPSGAQNLYNPAGSIFPKQHPENTLRCENIELIEKVVWNLKKIVKYEDLTVEDYDFITQIYVATSLGNQPSYKFSLNSVTIEEHLPGSENVIQDGSKWKISHCFGRGFPLYLCGSKDIVNIEAKTEDPDEIVSIFAEVVCVSKRDRSRMRESRSIDRKIVNLKTSKYGKLSDARHMVKSFSFQSKKREISVHHGGNLVMNLYSEIHKDEDIWTFSVTGDAKVLAYLPSGCELSEDVENLTITEARVIEFRGLGDENIEIGIVVI